MIRLDFKELEARAAAHFNNNQPRDLHAIRAAKEFGVPLEEVTAEMRRVGKHLNYIDLYSPERRTNNEDS